MSIESFPQTNRILTTISEFMNDISLRAIDAFCEKTTEIELDLNGHVDIKEQNRKLLLNDQPLSVTQNIFLNIQTYF